jgi:hypothetical protein
LSKATCDIGKLLVSELVDIALESESKASGSSKQEIARQVLERWQRQRHVAFKVYAKRLRAQGLQMELEGIDEEEEGRPSK